MVTPPRRPRPPGGPALPVSWPVCPPPLLRPCCCAAAGGGRPGGAAGGGRGGRGGASGAPGAVSNEPRGARAPEDPSPLRPLPTAHLVPGKLTGKSAGPGTPDPGLSQVEVPDRAQAGGTFGSPCLGDGVGISVEGGRLPGPPSWYPSTRSRRSQPPIPAASFPRRRENVAFFFLTIQVPPPLGKW